MAWIAPVIQAGMGLFQTISASKAAKNLPDRQTFQVSPEMRRAEEMALRGRNKECLLLNVLLSSKVWLVEQGLLNEL
jgi:hypothetical protein